VIINDKNIGSLGEVRGTRDLCTYNPLLFFRGSPTLQKELELSLLPVVF
jgi:hypothetical protein